MAAVCSGLSLFMLALSNSQLGTGFYYILNEDPNNFDT